MQSTLRPVLSLFLAISILASCKKNDTPAPPLAPTNSILVLNEGLFGQNNTSITAFNISTNTATTDAYKNVNGSGLGDTGNDMLVYGSKLYVVMNVSSYLEIAEAKTLKSLKKIPMKNGAADRSPRFAIGSGGKVFVSSWDGTVAVLDTATLTITKFIAVGSNPEQMAVANNRLYVCNSGGLNFPNFDSTVSVIDLGSLTETTKIKVGINPTRIVADESGFLYVTSPGNFGSIAPRITKINAVNNTVAVAANRNVATLAWHNGKLLATGSFGATDKVIQINTADLSTASAGFITDGTVITTPYGLKIDPSNGDVYVCDAKDYISSGSVTCFDNNGKRKFSFSTAPGLNPNSVVFIR
jgi:YVTN family beta-propeller protein